MEKEKNVLSPEQLRDRIGQIVKKAAADNGHISAAEINDYFADCAFSGEQLRAVYDFLMSRKIIVEGYDQEEAGEGEPEGEEPAGPAWSPEEQKWLETYQKDLASLPGERPGEWEKIIHGLRSGDREAKKRAAELFLPAVVQEAEELYRPGIHLSDLIQEGSLHLMLYIDSLPKSLLADREDVTKEIRREIRAGMQAMLSEQDEVHARDHKLVERVEELRDGVAALKEEYGRKVYLDEVADFMNITEEEAEDILKLAGEDISDEPQEEGTRGNSPA